MSVDLKEIKRVTQLQAGNKCQHCKVGYYQKLRNGFLLCENCGNEPILNFNYENRN